MGRGPFGELLCAYRRAAGLTQEQLAEKAGLSVQAVSSLERGVRRSPRRGTIDALAEALDLIDAEREGLSAARSARGPMRPRAIVAGRIDREPLHCLPLAVGDFTGRSDQVDRLHALLSPTDGSPTVVVSAIGGMGGVGKTALALHIGHQLLDAYPDGQLYVNLRGFGPGEPMTPVDALGVLLASLGVPSSDIPADADQAAARYRSLHIGRRLLVVLDNAADERQVDSLLPSAAGSAAIVTSRRTLAALPGAHHIQLDVLTDFEAVQLLTGIVGADRANETGSGLRRIVELCGRLPLAIRIAGARLAARPGWSLDSFAEQLADEHRKLDLLAQHDVGVRASLTVSVAQLAQSPDPIERAAASVVPLLGVLEVPDLDVITLARAIDRPTGETERILGRLVDLHLIDESEPRRYRMHDLVRAFAAELAHEDLSGGERAGVLERVLRHHNATAWRALRDLNPTHVRLSFMNDKWVDREPELMPPDVVDAWLSTEWCTLISLVEQAERERGVPVGLVTQVAIASLNTFHPRGLWARWMEVIEVSRRLAEASGDLIGQAFARYDLGGARSQLGHNADGETHLVASLELFRRAGSLAGEGMAACHLAHVLELQGRYHDGLEHAHRSLAIAELHGYEHLAATACLALSMLHGRLSHDEPERYYSERSLEIFAKIGYEPGRARALYNLGLVHSRLGRGTSALRLLLDAADACDEHDLPETGAAARAEAAAVRIREGRPQLAVRYCEQALSVSERTGCEIAEARSRQALGNTFAALGERRRARSEWRHAMVIYERLGAAAADEVRHLLARSGPAGSGHRRASASAR